MFRKLLLLLIFCCGLSTALLAQPRTGPMSGFVYEMREEMMQQRRSALVGAVVEVQSATDTLHTTTDLNGNFHFKAVPSGKVRVRVTYLGYKPHERDSVHIAPRYGLARPLRIQLEQESQKIDNVVIEGRAQLSTQRGDTLIFNAAAVRTMEGDEAINILEQMPGVEVSDDGSVKVLGEQIARVYVNGRQLFGEDPKAALTSLLAQEIVNLEVYDEDTDEERTAGRRFAEKQRVMNVRTKVDIASLIDGFFLASGGADLAKDIDGNRQPRYGVGTTVNLYSEKLRLTLDAYSNNIGRKSNRLRDILRNRLSTGSYKEQHYAYFCFSKLWGKSRREGQAFDLSYTYNGDYTRSQSATRRNYFATTSSPERIYADTTHQSSTGDTHTVKLYGLFHPGGKHQISSRNEFSFSTPESRSTQQITNRSETLDQQSELRQRSAGESYSIKNNLNYFWNNPRVIRPYLSLNTNISHNDRAGWRSESLDDGRQVLETDYIGPHEHYSAEFSLQKDIYETDGMRMELFASYQLDYEHSRTRQTALDVTSPIQVIDPTNTYNYTYNYTTHWERFAYRINSSLYRLNAIVDVRSAQMNKEEYYPETINYDERFVSILPSLSFTLIRHGRRINIFRYETSATLPSVEQLRDRLDNSNPLLLQAGNPALKQSIQHSIALSYPGNVNANNGRNIRFDLTANIRQNHITQRSYYFAEETPLTEWEYVASAGSTLYTYENISGAFNIAGSMQFSQRIQPLRSTLSLSLRHNYNQQPTYIGDQKNLSRQHQPSFSIGLGGTQSQAVRLSVHSTTTYTDVKNTIGEDTRYLYENLSGHAELRLWKHLICHLDYNLAHCHYLTNTGRDNTTQMLNAMVGCQLMKGRMQLGVAAYDLLNRGSSFSSTTYADYEMQQWRPSYGRYFTINIGYRLNRKAGTKGYEGNNGYR